MAALRRPAPKLSRVWVGANFWSRAGGPLMWRTFDEAVVRAELQVLMAHGLNVTRSFLYWPDFMPEPDRSRETPVTELKSPWRVIRPTLPPTVRRIGKHYGVRQEESAQRFQRVMQLKLDSRFAGPTEAGDAESS